MSLTLTEIDLMFGLRVKQPAEAKVVFDLGCRFKCVLTAVLLCQKTGI